jgi:hypothetical protein
MESYPFLFQSMQELAFVGDIQLPMVIVCDQPRGLIAAIGNQYCNWHAVEAMKAIPQNSSYDGDDGRRAGAFFKGVCE